MATDLKLLVDKEIARLKKDIALEASALASLRDDLKRHEAIYGILEEGRVPKSRRRTRPRKHRAVNWSAMLEDLPKVFTIDTLAGMPPAKGKPRLHLQQVVSRWAKEGKHGDLGRGNTEPPAPGLSSTRNRSAYSQAQCVLQSKKSPQRLNQLRAFFFLGTPWIAAFLRVFFFTV